MNFYFDCIGRYLDPHALTKITNIRVGLAGLGGLGSNCAFNLVRSGFRRFVLADFDRVEPSNLNRQFYFTDQVGMAKTEALKENLLKINPHLELKIHCTRVTQENIDLLFQDCHVIVEAFDSVTAKRMIVSHFINTDRLLVAASGLGGWGESDRIGTNKIKPNFYLIGDLQTAVDQKHPPLSPRVNIAAAKMADVILTWSLEYYSKGDLS